MFSCYAPEKKSKKQNVNDLEDNKNKSDISNDDISNIHKRKIKFKGFNSNSNSFIYKDYIISS